MQDIHTHLYWKSYDTDRDEVVARARAIGVKEMFVIGCTVDESRQALEIAEKYPDTYAAVGIHPHEFNVGGSSHNDTDLLFLQELKSMTENPKVLAIGECGLDYYSHDKTKVITEEEKLLQKKGFEGQLDLAQGKKLPVIVHCREAYEDMFEILSHRKDMRAFVLHCYMGDTEVTQKFLTLPNVYFSFTGNITYPVKKAILGTKDDLTETVKLIPLERIFTETDCPFLTPQSRRGERNEPSFVKEVLERIAELQGVKVVDVEQVTENNLETVFFKL